MRLFWIGMSEKTARRQKERWNGAVARGVTWFAFLAAVLLLSLLLFLAPPFANARVKDAAQYGMGLIVNIPLPENEVSQAGEEVGQKGIIRGSKEDNKDEDITGAKAEKASRAFPSWNEGGKVFYKVRT